MCFKQWNGNRFALLFTCFLNFYLNPGSNFSGVALIIKSANNANCNFGTYQKDTNGINMVNMYAKVICNTVDVIVNYLLGKSDTNLRLIRQLYVQSYQQKYMRSICSELIRETSDMSDVYVVKFKPTEEM